jgi:hypothetical protein
MDSEIKREIDDGIIQSPMAQVSEEKKWVKKQKLL